MQKLLAIIILSLYVITPSQADDSTDFQLAGISLKESLLEHYSLNEIKKKNHIIFIN